MLCDILEYFVPPAQLIKFGRVILGHSVYGALVGRLEVKRRRTTTKENNKDVLSRRESVRIKNNGWKIKNLANLAGRS